MQNWKKTKRRKKKKDNTKSYCYCGDGVLTDRNRPSSSSCANFRIAYHNCFNKWYSEFLKGQWDKQECVAEWDKYRKRLSQHLDDKHLSRFLDADALVDLNSEAEL